MKIKEGKIHIARPNQPTESMPETYCGLIIEPNDSMGEYDRTDKVVYYEHSKEQVPESIVCLSCLRIAGPCFYEFIRDEYKSNERSNQ